MTDAEITKLIVDAQSRLLTIADVVITVTATPTGVQIEADGLRFAQTEDRLRAALLLQSICLIAQKTKLKTLNSLFHTAVGPYIGIVTKEL